MDIIHQILAHNAGREPERLQRKYDRMRESAFVFLRATCPLFWRRLPAGLALFEAGPDGAPPVWSCGDLHFENYGSYKADNRLAYFDINDFGSVGPDLDEDEDEDADASEVEHADAASSEDVR